MARDTPLGFPRTPFLTVAENLLLYRQSRRRRVNRHASYDFYWGNLQRPTHAMLQHQRFL